MYAYVNYIKSANRASRRGDQRSSNKNNNRDINNKELKVLWALGVQKNPFKKVFVMQSFFAFSGIHYG
jgi:hypothetical protein